MHSWVLYWPSLGVSPLTLRPPLDKQRQTAQHVLMWKHFLQRSSHTKEVEKGRLPDWSHKNLHPWKMLKNRPRGPIRQWVFPSSNVCLPSPQPWSDEPEAGAQLCPEHRGGFGVVWAGNAKRSPRVTRGSLKVNIWASDCFWKYVVKNTPFP